MKAFRIYAGVYVNGRRVASKSDVVLNGRRAVRIRFVGDPQPHDYVWDAFVDGASVRLEIPAGPNPAGTWFVGGKPKPSADPMRGKWRGERHGGKADELIGVAKAFDAYAG